MAKVESIAVISSFATDRLIDSRTERILKEQRGGPILYLTQALEKLGLKPEIFYGEELLVEILITENDEFGRIKERPAPLLFPDVHTSSAIVSTILNEWDLNSAGRYTGLLFVDIQGYVRDGDDFGKKRAWGEIRNFAASIFCVKGNTIEIGMLPPDIVEDQKTKRMLIITKDKEGVEVFFRGNHVVLTPPEIVYPPNTIGAGDTFFANFVYQFMLSNDIESAARFALDKTCKFLNQIT